YGYAAPFGPAPLVTQDPFQTKFLRCSRLSHATQWPPNICACRSTVRETSFAKACHQMFDISWSLESIYRPACSLICPLRIDAQDLGGTCAGSFLVALLRISRSQPQMAVTKYRCPRNCLTQIWSSISIFFCHIVSESDPSGVRSRVEGVEAHA